jgi:hypothetical protein
MPITLEEIEKATPRMTKGERHIPEGAVEIGLMDDVAPNGSPNTACQRAVEAADNVGRILTREEEIAPGVIKIRRFMVASARRENTQRPPQLT